MTKLGDLINTQMTESMKKEQQEIEDESWMKMPKEQMRELDRKIRAASPAALIAKQKRRARNKAASKSRRSK